jgi:hypothetical protein
MRRDRGRLNGGAITYAPDTLRDGDSYIVAPRDADYERLRWLPIVDEPPTTPPREGYHWERTRPAEEGGEIRWQYAEVADPPPPPRVFRRSYLAQWIRGAGKWGAFAAFLADPAAADIAFLWQYCTEFDEDAPQWPAALAAIKAALALTDAEAEAMLDFGATGGVAQ